MNTFHRTIALVAGLASLVTIGPAQSADGPSQKEKDLIAVLRSGAPAEKAMTCKELAVHGSSAAVPELAKLLADEQLASWARIPLEAIPDKACDEALRNATYSLQGKLLVGVIN